MKKKSVKKIDDNKKMELAEKRLKIAKVGYWITVPLLVLMGLGLVFGEAELADKISILAMFLILFFLGYLGLDSINKEERLAKIAHRAMTVSWFFTLITVSLLALLWSTYLSGIGTGQVLGIMILVMVSSMAFTNEVYKRKGDVDW